MERQRDAVGDAKRRRKETYGTGDSCCFQHGHSPGKPGKVGVFDISQGKVRHIVVCVVCYRSCDSHRINTRMVQLPATAAIEYVAACWVSGAGGFLSGSAFVLGGSFVRGAYARSPQVQCLYAPSRLSVPSVVA